MSSESSKIDIEKIFYISKNVKIREENGKYMIVNIVTQGLHFISPLAFQFINNFNGIISLNDIYNSFMKNKLTKKNNLEYKRIFDKFVGKMVKRGVLVEQ
ncbi:MAG: hypothetical protein ACFFDF_20260 [Candidatus Odinarchaeota archaeon]